MSLPAFGIYQEASSTLMSAISSLQDNQVIVSASAFWQVMLHQKNREASREPQREYTRRKACTPC